MLADPHARIIVAVSGGVDSAVAALRLVKSGHYVEALHMTNWDDADENCTAGRDLADARRVCADIGITLHHVNFEKEYREQVFADFIAGLKAGLTPNPDVACNRLIKFGAFLAHATRLGADFVATGHYARLRQGDVARLFRAADVRKDQTYFLHAVQGSALARTLFPLGELTKSEVRRLAAAAGLANHARRDSTGICFIGKRPFRDFLARWLPAEPGPVRDENGRRLGTHDGLHNYTVGQRQGLGIGGLADRGDAPWYVAGKDHEANALIVVQGHEHPLLRSASLTAMEPRWIHGAPGGLATGVSLGAQIRYRQPVVACRVRGLSNGDLDVRFDQPQWAVTPGQHVVFYAGDECLGGALITRHDAGAVTHRTHNEATA